MTKDSNNQRTVSNAAERPRDVLARSLLRDSEKLVRVARIHPGIYWKAIAVFGLGLWLFFTIKNLGIFLLLVSAIMFVFAYLTKYYLLLAITDQRVLIRHGIVNLDVIDLQYKRVESVELSRSLMGRILGYATILVTGTGSRVTAVPFIANPSSFRSELDKLVYAHEQEPIRVKAE